jgi:hypothetical protein
VEWKEVEWKEVEWKEVEWKEVEWKEVEWKEVEWKEVNKIKVVVAEVRAGRHVESRDIKRAIAHLKGTTSWAKRYAVK